MIYRPVCAECSVEMRCSKNGRVVKSQGHGDYGYFHGDEYTCPGCKHRVVVGFGHPCHDDLVTDAERKSLLVVA